MTWTWIVILFGNSVASLWSSGDGVNYDGDHVFRGKVIVCLSLVTNSAQWADNVKCSE